jgi:hypothetical protein
MSLFPMLGPQIALSFYEQTLPIEDTAYVRSASGRDERQTLAPRNIRAAVDPSGSKRLEQIFGGSITDGDIGIFTKSTLYFVDEFGTDPIDKKQSFVTYSGKKYRVTDFSDWTTQAAMRVYLASRHTSIQAGVE